MIANLFRASKSVENARPCKQACPKAFLNGRGI